MVQLRAFLLCVTVVLLPRSTTAQGTSTQTAQELKRLSIEELAELDVTSVSRRTERLSETAAAVSIVRQDDIRRAGPTNLAEAMRLADGIDVARFDGRTWAISARGFNTNTANKLLVLMDGRTLYSPLSSGTFWDVQEALLADVDRIEVIRGPGGATWGANAMNGVVNIILRDAAATRGTAVLLAAGNETEAIASARHGGRFGAAGSYRVYGKYRRNGPNRFASGASAEDPLQIGQGGFRIDSDDRRATRWSLQADAYRGTEGLFDRPDTDVSGGNVLGRVTRRFSTTSEFRTQVYYDATYRNVPRQFEEMRHTFEVDAQHRVQPNDRHDVIFGGGFRVSHAVDKGESIFVFDPEARTNTLFSFFLQDEIGIRPDVHLTVGSKFERNDFTGFEPQPTARLRWRPDDRQTLWTAVSRAVRLPTRFDTDLRLIVPTTRTVVLSGQEDFDAESVVAVEGGYRVRPHARVSVDIATFRNYYNDLRSLESPAAPGSPTLLANMRNARTAGVELGVTSQLTERWRVHGSYTYLHMTMTLDPGSRDRTSGVNEANDPSYLASLRSYFDLPRGLALDAFLRHVARRPNPFVPAYTQLDLRLGWMLRAGWEVSLVGQNLLHDRHPELGAPGPLRYEFERGIYARPAWRF